MIHFIYIIKGLGGRKLKKSLVVPIILIFLFSFITPINAEAKDATYTVSPSTKPVNKTMLKYAAYNKYTKHYYMLRSYLEKLEKKGGGTLVLKKGTYSITNALYVPSNVTIILNNGVVIEKGNKTGTKSFGPSKSIFQFIAPSKSHKKGVYGGYKGEKNISIIGKGTAVINLKYIQDSIAIVAGHNRNIRIENIQFNNMYSGHFIEIDATKDSVICNNKFINSKASPNVNKEAINLDTPDKNTKGWNNDWSKYDKTPNYNLTIENNTFNNLDRAIGTHKYSEEKYHENIAVKNNTIENTRNDAIRVMNWKNPTIENNTISKVANGEGTYRGILLSGAINPTIKNNSFLYVARPIQIFPWKNSGPGSQYAITYNELSDQNIEDLKTNRIAFGKETFIRINQIYNVFDKDTIKIPIQEFTVEN